MKLLQNLDRLRRQGNDVQLAHLHARGRDSPLALVEVDLGPLRAAQLPRPHEDERREAQRALRHQRAVIAIDRAQQGPDALRVSDRRMVALPRRLQSTAQLDGRIALGAPRTSIIGLVVASTGAMLGIGVAAGVGLSTALSGVVTSWAGGSSRDPVILSVSAAVLMLVAMAACVVPAWRAATIDPLRALRTE